MLLNEGRGSWCQMEGFQGTKDKGTRVLSLRARWGPCREFTLNMISEWFIEAANFTCGNYDHGVNELELANFTPLPSVTVSPLV